MENQDGALWNRKRAVRCGVRLHGVPDQIVMASLAGQLHRHVGADWYACVMFSDGDGICLGARDGVVPPPENVIAWLADKAIVLNKELHNNGHWIVAWSPAHEPVLIWRDGDGDIHVAVEVSAKAETIDTFDRVSILTQAAKALSEARERVGFLELGRGQTHRLAQQMAGRSRH